MIDYERRTRLLGDLIEKNGLDAIFIANALNVSYLSGFKGRDSMVLVMPEKKYFITDSRYTEDARETLKSYLIKSVKGSAYETLKNIVSANRLKRIGFESMHLPFEVAARLRKMVTGTRFIPIKNLIEKMRSIKEPAELALIKHAIGCIKAVFNNVRPFIRPGASEESLSIAVELNLIKDGARPSFDPIIATTQNSYKPHARPTGTKVSRNDLVMVDVGAKVDGYNSDITRMVSVGKLRKKLKEICEVVCQAQEMAIRAIKPGVKACEVDAAARQYIRDRGFGKYFGHALGHGVGIDVHEYPAISCVNKDALVPNMVFTVEPAIYIPGVGGVRIEDMVVVTETGCEILTN